MKIILGQYTSKKRFCNTCGAKWKMQEEKMTDVNISVDLIMDADNDKYDTAILISGDSDLVPPLKILKNQFKQKRTVSIFPPARSNKEVKKNVSASFVLGRKILLDSQFENEIELSNGYVLTKPEEWE